MSLQEIVSAVEAPWKQSEIIVINPTWLKEIFDKMNKIITGSDNLLGTFNAYIAKFRGLKNLWSTADALNRDFEHAKKGDISELTRKLGLDTITGIQKARAASEANVRAYATNASDNTLPGVAKADGKPKKEPDNNGTIVDVLRGRDGKIDAAVKRATG